MSTNMPSVGAGTTDAAEVAASATDVAEVAADATRRATFASTVSLVIVPAEHDLLPDAVYPLLHVGVHELSIARLDVQSPSAPFVGAVVAWQVGTGVGLHTNTPNPH